eukprot:1756774-Amphidinium_carterae.1
MVNIPCGQCPPIDSDFRTSSSKPLLPYTAKLLSINTRGSSEKPGKSTTPCMQCGAVGAKRGRGDCHGRVL